MNHLKYKIIRGWLLKKDKGLTLVEVLVGILILSAFAIAALQALAIATQMKVSAERKSRANNWIQENIEEAKFWASGSQEGEPFEVFTQNNADSNFWNYVDPDGDGYETDWQDNSLCGSVNPTNQGDGFGALLEAFLESANGYDYNPNTTTTIDGTDYNTIDNDNFLGRDFQLLYQPQVSNQDPFNTLQLTYIVINDNDDSPSEDDIITRINTEIIPDAAYQC